ncbi:MHYT domain-containing protein [Actibacterium sp. MT2.3-13A]|uniref:MHYT domain-containing protein n=1 Tax=Actibacterium sp. MT2.3-13A TaxID=2828332 RepID=UPI00201121CC|nr:MHYT domain-containing protein [Actibacterium sp. MT2.3-13A]
MLDYSHDYLLVAASLAIALMAGFTGLSLTRGASERPVPRRKMAVAMSAVALGGGIWSMHFVAMLGLTLPVLFYYDALITMISALLAILITGIALLIVHFGRRTRGRIVLAGAIVGVGIPVMHYVGMSGIQLCRPVYTLGGVALALTASMALSITAFLIAYGNRDARNIILGTLGFGLAVFAVHFIAMAGTGFVEVAAEGAPGPWISNEALAFGVTLAAFVISGAFLLTGVTFAVPGAEGNEAGPAPGAQPRAATTAPVPPPEAEPHAAFRLPYEKEGRTHFVAADEVAAIRAEGHYTLLYLGAEKLFCPWSISEAENRIPGDDFVRTHRSYLVNRRHVTSFERKKDTGICYFDGVESLSKVPVSRSRLAEVRDRLGL